MTATVQAKPSFLLPRSLPHLVKTPPKHQPLYGHRLLPTPFPHVSQEYLPAALYEALKSGGLMRHTQEAASSPDPSSAQRSMPMESAKGEREGRGVAARESGRTAASLT